MLHKISNHFTELAFAIIRGPELVLRKIKHLLGDDQ